MATTDTDLLGVTVLAAIHPVDDDLSAVQVRLEGLATSAAGGTKRPCITSGKLEKKLVEQLRLQVKR